MLTLSIDCKGNVMITSITAALRNVWRLDRRINHDPLTLHDTSPARPVEELRRHWETKRGLRRCARSEVRFSLSLARTVMRRPHRETRHAGDQSAIGRDL